MKKSPLAASQSAKESSVAIRSGSFIEKYRSLLVVLTALNITACSGGDTGNEHPNGNGGYAGVGGAGGFEAGVDADAEVGEDASSDIDLDVTNEADVETGADAEMDADLDAENEAEADADEADVEVDVDLCASKDCNDNNDCTDDSCNPADGNCINEPEVDKACNDNNAHTINDVCDDQGVCAGELADCIDDSECNDNNACNGEETCNTTSNECENGTPINYNNGLVCDGVESCDPATGNQIDDTDINCNDGVCTEPLGACACDAGYAGADCTSCDTAGGYIPSTTGGGCIDDPCEPNPFPNAACGVVNDQAIQGACDSGYIENNSDICVDDPCEPEACNSNGVCTMDASDLASCACGAGYAGGDCGSCDTASGLYENNYPTCSPDITAPPTPVITTNVGGNFTVFQANFPIEGTTSSDTYDMWRNIDGGTYSKFSHTSYNTSWLYNANIPSVWQARDFCFKASDKAGNMSGADCINANRLP